MTGKDNIVASRIKRVFVACVLVGIGVALAGCDAPSAETSAARPMADQERFLLSLVERSFQDPEAHYQLGEYYHSEGRWDKAQYHLNLALSFAPAFRKAQVALIRTLLDKGDRQAADRTVSTFLKQLSNSPLDTVSLAKAFASGGLDQYALACFDEGTKVTPGSGLAFKELGLYWLGKNDTAKAKQYLIHSFELDPSQPEVGSALGQLGMVVEVPRAPAEPATQVQTPDPTASQ